MIQKSAAHEITNHRVSALAAVVTHKVWMINDLSFHVQSREKQGGLDGDTDPDTVPQCLCAEALPKFLDELVTTWTTFQATRILTSKADVSDAFRNVRVGRVKSYKLRYAVGTLVVIDFRLTFGWSG